MNDLWMYRQWLLLRGCSRETLAAYLPVLAAFGEVIAPRAFAEATRDDVEAFLGGRKIEARARSQYLSRIAGFYRWLIDEGLAVSDPTARIPRPKLPVNLPRPIAPRDFVAAYAAADTRMRAWLALGYYAGFRAKEIAGLRAEDVQWWRDPPVLIVSAPKGHRQRVVPVHPLVNASLRAHGVPKAGYVFTRQTGSPCHLQAHTVSIYVSRFLASCGIAATGHQLRHGFGTNVYAACRDLRMTQELLGHADPATTAIYTELSPGEAATVVAGLP